MSPFMVPIVIFTMVPLCAVLLPIAKAYARRIEGGKRPSGSDPEIAARLERMEQAIEAIAVEVERVSEGQRFTTKLLSERGAMPNVPQAVPDSTRDAR